ncbi:hypothetical protein NAI48_13195, partial [Francisella tularensis subsp. holarctica]|nr:hypothetical protein [Francisella tularensis subsp. holarctica]
INTKKIRNYDGGYILLSVIIGVNTIYYSDPNYQGSLDIAFLLGIVVHESIGLINSLFDTAKVITTYVARNGLIGF